MYKNIQSDALLIHLTISQLKDVIEGVFQQSSSIQSNQPEIIGIAEVSRLTGYKKATIYALIHQRKIPFYKPANNGRRIFFKSAEIEKWLQTNRIETNEEFFQNHRENKKGQTNNKIQLRQRLHTLKLFYQLFAIFLSIINRYKAQIQELEEKIAKYERDNQMIENLFINDFNYQK